MNIPTRRHATTLLFLLRGYAQEQRRSHGKLVEREGGIQLTPDEIEEWAQEIEKECVALPRGESPLVTAATTLHRHAAPKKVIIQPNMKTKRGRK